MISRTNRIMGMMLDELAGEKWDQNLAKGLSDANPGNRDPDGMGYRPFNPRERHQADGPELSQSGQSIDLNAVVRIVSNTCASMGVEFVPSTRLPNGEGVVGVCTIRLWSGYLCTSIPGPQTIEQRCIEAIRKYSALPTLDVLQVQDSGELRRIYLRIRANPGRGAADF